MQEKKISITETCYNWIKQLSDEQQLVLYKAILEYWFEWKENKLSWIEQVIFELARKTIDISNIRSEVSKWHKWWNRYTKQKENTAEPTTKEDVKPQTVVEDNSSVKKEWLKKYWQYVELTDEEYKNLVYQFGSCSWYTYQWEAHLKLNSKPVDDKIESMNNYIINWKWKPYPDYYMELRYRFKREWKMPYWERWSAEEMKAYLEKENNRQLYYRAYVEFREKIDYIKHTLWKIDIIKNQEFFDEYDWHFFLDY